VQQHVTQERPAGPFQNYCVEMRLMCEYGIPNTFRRHRTWKLSSLANSYFRRHAACNPCSNFVCTQASQVWR